MRPSHFLLLIAAPLCLSDALGSSQNKLPVSFTKVVINSLKQKHAHKTLPFKDELKITLACVLL